MQASVEQILSTYNDRAALSQASTIPAPWYVDPRIAELERLNVFSKTWQLVARTSQVQNAGDFVATRLAGEPIVVVRGSDGTLRAFYNVCRHHAAAVVTQPCGQAAMLQCPYHGWKYGLDGSLKGMPEFDGVENFDRAQNGLVPVRVETWECFVFVNLDPQAVPLTNFWADSYSVSLPSASASCIISIGEPTTFVVTGRSTSIIISMADITSPTCIRV